MVEDLAAQPSASVPPASRDPAALQGTDDFWQSPRGKASAIVSAHGQSPLERMVGTDIGLAIQDPTEVNFTTHPQRPGVGYLDHPKSRGVKHHSGWAVSGQGVPVGLLHQHLWGRALAQLGKTQQRRQRPTPAQESQRWLDCWQQTKPIMPPPSNGGMVGDREADFYDLFALAAQQSCPILGRAAQDRLVQTAEATETTWLKATLAALPVMGPGPILLKHHPERPERLATLTIRCTTLELQKPPTASNAPSPLMQLWLGDGAGSLTQPVVTPTNPRKPLLQPPHGKRSIAPSIKPPGPQTSHRRSVNVSAGWPNSVAASAVTAMGIQGLKLFGWAYGAYTILSPPANSSNYNRLDRLSEVKKDAING
jgi:hypothetical protein